MNSASQAYNPNPTDTQEVRVFIPASPVQKTFCASCQQESTATYLGEQEWPLRVANAMGIKPIVTLWQCDHCGTSFTVTQLTD